MERGCYLPKWAEGFVARPTFQLMWDVRPPDVEFNPFLFYSPNQYHLVLLVRLLCFILVITLEDFDIMGISIFISLSFDCSLPPPHPPQLRRSRSIYERLLSLICPVVSNLVLIGVLVLAVFEWLFVLLFLLRGCRRWGFEGAEFPDFFYISGEDCGSQRKGSKSSGVWQSYGDLVPLVSGCICSIFFYGVVRIRSRPRGSGWLGYCHGWCHWGWRDVCLVNGGQERGIGLS